ncbi:Uncharacterised protein [Vibrio cholerae]|nr:Uncharacterised protein [Vibrio cholerae]
MAKTHQLCQHFSTTNNRDAFFTRRLDFRVLFINSRRDHDHACVSNIVRFMTNKNGRAFVS